jgi:hypothetical protein
MPATPIFALPYPAPSDTADVPRDLQALAVKLDAIDLSAGAELGYWPATANVAFPATTEAAATVLIAGGAVTYDGKPVLIDFAAPFVQNGTGDTFAFLYLFDGATSLGKIGAMLITVANGGYPIRAGVRITPAAGAHTYNIRGSVSGGSGLMLAGPGGVGAYQPAGLRITRAKVT